MRNIKEIRAEMSQLRDAYEAKITMLEEEIQAVRNARGFVPKVPAYEDFYEAGRSRMPGYYEQDGGSMCNGIGRAYF